MNIWSRRAVISQTYQGMKTFLESPQLDENNMPINRLTNRPCFPSIFDVFTMLKVFEGIMGQVGAVLKLLPKFRKAHTGGLFHDSDYTRS